MARSPPGRNRSHSWCSRSGQRRSGVCRRGRCGSPTGQSGWSNCHTDKPCIRSAPRHLDSIWKGGGGGGNESQSRIWIMFIWWTTDKPCGAKLAACLSALVLVLSGEWGVVWTVREVLARAQLGPCMAMDKPRWALGAVLPACSGGIVAATAGLAAGLGGLVLVISKRTRLAIAEAVLVLGGGVRVQKDTTGRKIALKDRAFGRSAPLDNQQTEYWPTGQNLQPQPPSWSWYWLSWRGKGGRRGDGG